MLCLHAAAGSGYDEAEEEELASEPAVPDYSAYTYTGTHVSSNNWWLLENYDGLKRNTIHKKVQADIRSKNQNLAPDELTIYYRQGSAAYNKSKGGYGYADIYESTIDALGNSVRVPEIV